MGAEYVNGTCVLGNIHYEKYKYFDKSDSLSVTVKQGEKTGLLELYNKDKLESAV